MKIPARNLFRPSPCKFQHFQCRENFCCSQGIFCQLFMMHASFYFIVYMSANVLIKLKIYFFVGWQQFKRHYEEDQRTGKGWVATEIFISGATCVVYTCLYLYIYIYTCLVNIVLLAFHCNKAVSATVFLMINAAYHDKRLIFYHCYVLGKSSSPINGQWI